jgi:hypothetical protein
VGHRALVAVERESGTFDCYRSHWDGTRFGQGADAVASSAVDGAGPLATSVSASRVLAHLDPRADEALLVRSSSRTDAYLVRWLGVPSAAVDGRGPTVLAPVERFGAAELSWDRLDCAIRTAKANLGDAVDAGLIPHSMAVGYLTAFVARHADLPAGAVWLAPDEAGTEVGR